MHMHIPAWIDSWIDWPRAAPLTLWLWVSTSIGFSIPLQPKFHFSANGLTWTIGRLAAATWLHFQSLPTIHDADERRASNWMSGRRRIVWYPSCATTAGHYGLRRDTCGFPFSQNCTFINAWTCSIEQGPISSTKQCTLYTKFYWGRNSAIWGVSPKRAPDKWSARHATQFWTHFRKMISGGLVGTCLLKLPIKC